MSSKNTHRRWELRYSSDIAQGRALFDIYYTELDARRAERDLIKSLRVNGLPNVAASVGIHFVSGGSDS